MSVLLDIRNALNNVGFIVGEGKYPETTQDCGKIVFNDEDRPVRYFDGKINNVESFDVVVKGGSYSDLENKLTAVKTALISACFIQIGGFRHIEPKNGETFLQLAVQFKSIK